MDLRSETRTGGPPATAKRLSMGATMAIGVYLLCCRWIVGGATDAVWSAYLTGSLVLIASGCALAVPRSRWIFAVRTLSGAWLVASPFVLGFAGTPAATSAWVAGALLFAAGEPWRALLDLAASAHLTLLQQETWRLRPQQIASARVHVMPESPELLGCRILECSTWIRKALRQHPSESDVEMCVLGYGACVEDMVTLAGMVAEERRKAGALRRLRLRITLGMASHSVARAREAMPERSRTLRAGRSAER